jgi:hypothetical protein
MLIDGGCVGCDRSLRLIAEVSDRKRCRLNLDDGNTTPDFANSGAALLRSLGEEPTLEDQKKPKICWRTCCNCCELSPIWCRLTLWNDCSRGALVRVGASFTILAGRNYFSSFWQGAIVGVN